MARTILCDNIKWDTDGEDVELPDNAIISVDDDCDIYEEAASYLSDAYGWCVLSLDVQEEEKHDDFMDDKNAAQLLAEHYRNIYEEPLEVARKDFAEGSLTLPGVIHILMWESGVDARVCCKFCLNHGEMVKATKVAPQHDGGDTDVPAVWVTVCEMHFDGWYDDIEPGQELPAFSLEV